MKTKTYTRDERLSYYKAQLNALELAVKLMEGRLAWIRGKIASIEREKGP